MKPTALKTRGPFSKQHKRAAVSSAPAMPLVIISTRPLPAQKPSPIAFHFNLRSSTQVFVCSPSSLQFHSSIHSLSASPFVYLILTLFKEEKHECSEACNTQTHCRALSRTPQSSCHEMYSAAENAFYFYQEQYLWNKKEVDNVCIYHCAMSHLKQTANEAIYIAYSLEKNHCTTLGVHPRQIS